MRSSTVLATLFATLAVASPLHQHLHKRVYAYDIVTEIVTVTVTAGHEPETTVRIETTVVVVPTESKVSISSTTTKAVTTTSKTTTTPPPPPPTTTSTTTTPPPPPPPTTTPPPPPPPTTTQPPAPVLQPTQAPAPAPVVVDSTPQQAPSSSSGDAVRDAALNSHNAYRAKHHAGPLTWDDSLASSAAALAATCTNKHGMIVGGQNIAAQGFSGQSGPSDADLMSQSVDSWYSEVSMFGGLYGQADVTDMSVLHFTQVVWKATTQVGCAVNNCGTTGNIFPGFSSYTIVCNYLAAGNFAGQYAVNVAAP